MTTILDDLKIIFKKIGCGGLGGNEDEYIKHILQIFVYTNTEALFAYLNKILLLVVATYNNFNYT